MTITLSRAEARRFLARYHFAPTDMVGTIERLATVQYDPLNPVGRNTDLVFQARVPGYQVDDWQKIAYTDRSIYDAWDKQSSPPKYRSTRPVRLSTVSESIQSA
ncbi:MAG: hypothetical protein ABI396_13355 [Ktedonobacteraceae bacterium]